MFFTKGTKNKQCELPIDTRDGTFICMHLPASIYRKRNSLVLSIVIVSLILLGYLFLYRPAPSFPVGTLIEIKDGLSLAQISSILKDHSVIRSEILFELFVTMMVGEGGAKSGDYFFAEPLSVFAVAKKISSGDFGLTPVKVTIPEGATVYDIAELLKKKFTDFDSIGFLKIAKDKEGYLFPDTYFFLPNTEPQQVVRHMERNFIKKVGLIKDDIKKFGKPLKDVIIMASLLEKEARTLETKQMIAGILWKRIEIGMPLQVDAVFSYINGKNTYTLTLDDLKIDSPYNTYKYKGLPVGPIANPGLESIQAAVTPIESNYLYYLSDRQGNMYYAEDFDTHKKNKRLYLN